jgi:toxin ParE1/3/4
MRLRLSALVPGDLEEIADYIAHDRPREALRFLRKLRTRMKEIAKRPKLYQLRPELGQDARWATEGNYVILFRIHRGTVRIERVLHGSREMLQQVDWNEGNAEGDTEE